MLFSFLEVCFPYILNTVSHGTSGWKPGLTVCLLFYENMQSVFMFMKLVSFYILKVVFRNLFWFSLRLINISSFLMFGFAHWILVFMGMVSFISSWKLFSLKTMISCVHCSKCLLDSDFLLKQFFFNYFLKMIFSENKEFSYMLMKPFSYTSWKWFSLKKMSSYIYKLMKWFSFTSWKWFNFYEINAWVLFMKSFSYIHFLKVI